MENRAIGAELSAKSLTFRPGSAPVSFEVTVINGSEQFAAFQLEVLAAGAGRRLGPLWYRLSPEVSAAKPPGGVTKFQVVIFDTPLTAFVGIINLTVRIFSPQLREERKLQVRLTVEPGSTQTLLSVDLPVRQFKVYPRNPLDIPVRVQNLSSQRADVVLRLIGLNPAWLTGGAERRLWVDPGTPVETSFQCQPPAALQAPSQDYPFTVEAISQDSSSAHAEGSLEVLPVGFIEFATTPQRQTIPSSKGWLPNWKSDSASFQLLFKNTSNLRQHVGVQLQGRDQRKCKFKVIPENTEVSPGETAKVLLEVRTKRPWLGLGKTLQLEVKTLLSDQRLGSTDPATQPLELQVTPIVPLWLLLALTALLAVLLALLLRPIPIGHTNDVEVVRFSRDDLSVVSGSNDCTIRRWQVNTNSLKLEPEGSLDTREQVPCDNSNSTSPQPQGLLGVADQPIWALRFDPVENNRVALGLKDSVIRMWNVPERKQEYELRVTDLFLNHDKVFDLVFSKNSKYLISGHGSGNVLIWARRSPIEPFQPQPKGRIDLGYEVKALALNQDQKTLAVAGSHKYLTLLDVTQPNRQSTFSVTTLNGSYGETDYIWSLAFAQSLQLLATADSDGYITLIALDKCQINNAVNQQSKIINQECVQDQWQAGKMALRSLAFTQDGLTLVSAGDDGRVMAWSLTPQGKRETTAIEGREIYNGHKQINSIDINSQGNTIVAGGKDCQLDQGINHCQVKLLRLEK